MTNRAWVRSHGGSARPNLLRYTQVMSAAKAVLDAALKLEPVDRARVANELLESVADSPATELSDPWELEVQRRLAAIDAGTMEMIPEEQVFSELAAELRSRGGPK